MTDLRVDVGALARATLPLLPVERKPMLRELEEQYQELLYGDRRLATAIQNGVVTTEEAALGIADRIELWLVSIPESGLCYGDWESSEFVRVLKAALAPE